MTDDQVENVVDTPKRINRSKRRNPGVYLRDRTPMDADEPAIDITP